MSKLLLVIGATGQQGGAVVDYVLSDPDLAKQYKIRATTRDSSKPAAQALEKKGVEVVTSDVDDEASLTEAMIGVHCIFANTVTVYDERIKEREIAQGKSIADTAVAAGVEYLIYSTLPSPEKVSKGKYSKVAQFEAKAEVEVYIRTLPIKSAFFAPGSFMQNFAGIMAPHPNGDGTYSISNCVSPQTQFPLIETAADTGKFVGAILASPDKYEGKVFSAATKVYSFEDIANTISNASGKTVTYKQLPEEVFRGFLPPAAADALVEMLQYIQDCGYYGPETEELVEWASENAHSIPTTLEDYLQKNPIPLH